MTCSKGARLPLLSIRPGATALARTFQGYNPFDSAIDPEENFDSFVNKESSKCGADVRIAADAAM
jgi:hypothetical protein